MQSYPPSNFYLWQSIEERLRTMEARIAQLESQVKQQNTDNQALQEKIKQIKPIQIGTINYKVQELHVSELSGTLNIGLTALADEEELQKLMGSFKAQGEQQMENMETTFSNEQLVYDMKKLDDDNDGKDTKNNTINNNNCNNNNNDKQKKSTPFE